MLCPPFLHFYACHTSLPIPFTIAFLSTAFRPNTWSSCNILNLQAQILQLSVKLRCGNNTKDEDREEVNWKPENPMHDSPTPFISTKQPLTTHPHKNFPFGPLPPSREP